MTGTTFRSLLHRDMLMLYHRSHFRDILGTPPNPDKIIGDGLTQTVVNGDKGKLSGNRLEKSGIIEVEQRGYFSPPYGLFFMSPAIRENP